jgi:hypothetical protein
MIRVPIQRAATQPRSLSTHNVHRSPMQNRAKDQAVPKICLESA